VVGASSSGSFDEGGEWGSEPGIVERGVFPFGNAYKPL